MKYAAVIVETRPLLKLKDVIQSHMEKLPLDWELVVWHGTGNAAAMVEACLGYRVRCENMAVDSITIRDYNALLTSHYFWDKLSEYDRVLIFQADSMLLREGIGEFLEWDYIGAPWEWQDYGGNGGLSLRNPAAMKRAIEKHKWNGNMNEDTHFSNTMHIHRRIGRLAPRPVAAKFSCETIFALGTLGCHAIEKWLTSEQVEQIKNQYK